MNDENAKKMIQRLGFMRAPCDLDLLLFFVKHPRSLLTSESLSSFLGYSLKEIADSLETLLGSGLLERRQTAAHAARLYSLAPNDKKPEWFTDFVELSMKRDGLLSLKKALRGQSSEGTTKAIVDENPGGHLRTAARSFGVREHDRASGRKRGRLQ